MRLETQNISIGYQKPKLEVAQSINIEIKDSNLTAVIGVNGSGKSTLIKSLSKLLPICEGKILLNGKDFNNLSNNEIAKQISVVLTKEPLPQHLSVLDFVALGRQPYTNWLGLHKIEDKSHIIKSLKQVGLYAIKDRSCMSLSDGQLQKALIARAIAQNTPLIILDEPTSHLDMYHKALILNLLKTISQDHQKSVVFATHEINLALQLCDSIVLIKDKKVVQDSPQSLIDSGLLHQLFPRDLIRFDEDAKLFKMNSI
ncbi:ABC transporter ATP-binding protein [Flavobacterium sp. CS20]|jgi:iron complex transport system ATP-binding protein|uniref:ABC transporter ATP-binding protein n=1 Tax=Flavobacterium sp. CS20 TaxID=2775246 RepID=UPI001B3A4E4A|nr:ABC transporter ATP-binding protein [Flavobacterium sp. CS20]QTY28224.1 ABC transporter ATP-binding protein [Flavobacterium sp. CS20]